MITGKNNKKFEKLVTAFVNETFTDKGGDIEKFRSAITKLLFTPKLQWKLEEIRHHGGDILLATVHSVTNYHTSIQVYDPVNGTAGVNWNGNLVFEGTLEECKKYCSNKILDDFLKLCE